MIARTASQQLCALNRARRTLVAARNLDAIKRIRDQAEAVRQYVKSAGWGLELRNRAAEVKLLSERRAGELLAGLGLPGGDRKSVAGKKLSLADLGISPKQSHRWQLEASLPEDLFQEYVGDATRQDQVLTSAGLLRLARSHQRASDLQSAPAGTLGHAAVSLGRMVEQGKSFACIYADPLWSPASLHRNHSSATYADMLRSLQTLPVRKVSKRNAYLHLWTLPESLVVALQVLRAWGFRYQTHLLRTKAPADYGRYWRPSHELLLLGVRGTLAFRDNSLLSCDDEQFSSPAEKSASTRHLIERASPGPYLELFGSGSAPGWAFGRSSSKTIMTQMV